MRLANSTIRRAAILGTTTSTGPHQSSSANTSTKNEVASLCCGRKVYGDVVVIRSRPADSVDIPEKFTKAELVKYSGVLSDGCLYRDVGFTYMRARRHILLISASIRGRQRLKGSRPVW